MFTIIKACRWLYKTLNSDTRPWQMALAVLLGALAGLLPLGLGTVCVFMVILLINVHFGTATFVFALFQLASLPLQLPLIRPLGRFALERTPQDPIINAAQAPVVSLVRLDYYDVAGAVTLWLMLAIPLFLLTYVVWSKYQEKLQGKIGESKLFKWISKFWVFRTLKYIFAG